MNWELWKRRHNQQTVAAVAAFSSNPSEFPAHTVNTTAATFSALCAYCRVHFIYWPEIVGALAYAFQNKLINCQHASDLLIGVYLYRNQAYDVPADVHNVHGGNVPVVTPGIIQAGVRIQNNLRNGGGRMLFTAGHTIAQIRGVQFDLITGLSGPGLENQFIQAAPGPRQANGWPTYTCNIHGTVHTFKGIGGKTENGLSEFSVAPPIP